ncbi:DUF6376 family protein [Thermoflavimicrobium daqui]|uniref:Lipoprotein n=1 Tax=Thermoflavimicrobium daqui TaxID=2137476 RepID=A0A364K9J6_9BACL|nr:DUF6376 family protein [Thermoflavimicrobium daqui]RAL26969.1 hypothetical protein DL897_02710 [Thermoflavimicrobium daqui]
MKKMLMVSFVALFLLSGCSIDQRAGMVDYVKTTVRYTNMVNHLVNNIPSLALKATSDQQSKTTLEKNLNNVKSELQKYNEMIPPRRAEEIHQNMTNYNKTVESEINSYLKQIKKGNFDPKVFQTPAFTKTIQEMLKLRDQAQQLA